MKGKLKEAQDTIVQLKAKLVTMVDAPTATPAPVPPELTFPARPLPSTVEQPATNVQEDRQDADGMRTRIDLLVKDIATTQLALKRLHEKVP